MSNKETTQTTGYEIRPRTPDDVRRMTYNTYAAGGAGFGSLVLVVTGLLDKNPGLFFAGVASGVFSVTRTGEVVLTSSSTYIDPNAETNTPVETPTEEG